VKKPKNLAEFIGMEIKGIISVTIKAGMIPGFKFYDQKKAELKLTLNFIYIQSEPHSLTSAIRLFPYDGTKKNNVCKKSSPLHL
jgi:hypothetical protein